ncbi:SDR family NAD(P)-dependent oxidoreductase [Asticcacaulis solisilvae]|uniref:SDR family NAD(P)-dependent oxidoreductase n=1 Tax=Asticcacaulis solisilvae TaxID=1217274 RepID=UPI003FD887B9
MKGTGTGGSVVVITAAAGDPGQAMAVAFARDGMTLILADPDTHALKAVAARCRDAGAETHLVEADISDTASARKLVNAARQAGGRIDIWISQPDSARIPLDGITPDIRAVVPVFLKQKRGTLIHLVADTALPLSLRAQLSARRDIHLCDVYPGNLAAHPDRLAEAISALAGAPKAKLTFGVNDNMFGHLLRAGAGAGLATLASLSGLVTALDSARIG